MRSLKASYPLTPAYSRVWGPRVSLLRGLQISSRVEIEWSSSPLFT